MFWRYGLLVLALSVNAEEAKRWGFTPPAKQFSLDAVEENVMNGLSKLLFKVGNVYSGAAGGHQFATIWTRDFCHAVGGLLQQETWKIGDEHVPSTKIIMTTLKALLNVTKQYGTEAYESQIPRALDWFPIYSENALSAKVLQGGAYLKSQTVLPMYSDVGEALSPFPSNGPLQGYYQGENNVKETTDAGYLIVRAFATVMPSLSPEELANFLDGWGDKLRLVIDFYSDPSRWGSRDHHWFFTQTAYTEWKDSCKQEGASSYSNLQLIESLYLLFEQAKTSEILRQALVGVKLYGPRFGVQKPHLTIESTSVEQYADPVTGFEVHLKNWTHDVYDFFYDPEAGLLREISPSSQIPDQGVSKIAHIDAQLQWMQTCARWPELLPKISIDKIVEGFLSMLPDGNIRKIVGINAPSWPSSEVSWSKQAIGLFQYHGTFAWSWWACWFSELAAIQGRANLAEELLKWVWKAQNTPSGYRSKGFQKYFSEIYDGASIAQTIVYVSETPFLWGSSYCIRAANALRAAHAWEPVQETVANETLLQQKAAVSRLEIGSKTFKRRPMLRQGKLGQDDESALLQVPLSEDEEL